MLNHLTGEVAFVFFFFPAPIGTGLVGCVELLARRAVRSGRCIQKTSTHSLDHRHARLHIYTHACMYARAWRGGAVMPLAQTYCMSEMDVPESGCICLSVSLSSCVYLSVSFCVCLCLSVSVCVCLCLSVSVCVCLCLSVSVCVCLYICLSVSVCVCLSCTCPQPFLHKPR
jgi:hypothetical protein